MFGFLNIYKPKGITSHDVVAILRKITKIKQIGHTGTLDPFAEGVLPICIGKSTRLIEYLKDDKAYIGTVQFGKSTTSFDIDGETVSISDKKISLKDLENALTNFRGEIQQIPPIYSAIKIKGKKLYEYARNGENVEINPRTVFIQKLEIISFNEKLQTAELLIECSKGTYIRSIANDLGTLLGCYGYLTKLVRIKAGNFNLENSIMLEKIETEKDVLKFLKSPLLYMEYPQYNLNEKEKELVSHGMSININKQDGIIVLVYNDKLISIAEITNKKAKTLKVFI